MRSLLALGVGLWVYVRRRLDRRRATDSLRDALDDAARLRAVYLAAALVALGGAMSRPARPASARATRRRVGRRVPERSALAGDPARHERGLLDALAPDEVPPLARAVASPLRGRARRRRARARTSATPRLASRDGLAPLSTCLHVLHGLDHGDARAVLVLVAARRAPARLRRAGRPATRPGCARARARRRGAILAYGFARSGSTGHGRPAVHAPVRAARDGRGARRRELARLAAPRRRVRRMVPGLACCSWASPRRVAASPAGSRRGGTALRRRRASASSPARSSRAWGVDTLAPFVLRARQVVLLQRGRAGLPRVPGRRRRRDRVRRSDRAARAVRRLVGAFIGSRARATGGSRSSARRSVRSTSTARTACTRSTTATRRSSRRPRSRSRVAPIRKVRQSVHRLQSAGYRGAGAAPERDRRRPARGARGDRARPGGAMSRSVAS